MRTTLIIVLVLIAVSAKTQYLSSAPELPEPGFSLATAPMPDDKKKKDIHLNPAKWRLTNNHLWTGGLVFIAGATKGFNETLHFHWKEFKRQFPNANAKWFNPSISWSNKYKNNDPNAGPKYFLSTSALIMFTDQYHLNNFIHKMAWGSAVIIKIGEKKKPFKQYLLDFLYYAACNQAGFALTYYPFNTYRGK